VYKGVYMPPWWVSLGCYYTSLVGIPRVYYASLGGLFPGLYLRGWVYTLFYTSEGGYSSLF